MNSSIISSIKAELKKMYPGYRFDVKEVPALHSLSLTLFKGQNNLDTLNVELQTPMNLFWEEVIEWMREIIRVNGA